MVIESGSISNENTVNINGVSGEDLSSPLYMHPSNNPGVSFVQTLFDGVGYRSWKRSVLRVLSVKNKLGFINGDCKRPDPGTSLFHQWGRCDDMVTSWILNSLSWEIVESVEYVSDSVELWKELENRYDQTNGAKLYQVQHEINELSHGTLDITTYYTRMKKAKDSMLKVEQDRRLIQFLKGLNEDEKQREIKHNAQVFMKSASLNKSNSRKKVMESVAFNTNGSAGASTSRTHIICDYYKKPGNTRDKCNNQNPRFNKGKGLMDDVHGGCCSGEEGHMGTHADTGPQLTREQYAQFVELLQQFQAEKDNAFTIGNVNFAGSFNEEASGDW
ncbi:hypothetical protein KY285_028849 [Solanum tuberosum]|nr:hypothetical protein KY285_028849 [Solanum tuberosum]